MPSTKLAKIDPSAFPTDSPLLDLDEIQKLLPHRFEFVQVHKILSFDEDAKTCVAFREGADEEFWVRGHIPGRPMMPGVLMIEALAQAGILHAHVCWELHKSHPWVGFGGVERVRFREVVGPGEDLWLTGTMTRIDLRRGFVKWEGQALRGDGAVVCEATVLGLPF